MDKINNLYAEDRRGHQPTLRVCLFGYVLGSFWLKTVFTYLLTFNLAAKGTMQVLLMMVNPIATTALLFCLPLLFRRNRGFIISILLVDLVLTIYLYVQVVYYRQFSDYMTMNTVLSASKVSGDLGTSTLKLLSVLDIFYFIDFPLLVWGLVHFRKRLDFTRRYSFKNAGVALLLSLTLLMGNYLLANHDRPALLSKTFDNNYIVKYMGLTTFFVHDTHAMLVSNHQKAAATPTELETVQQYIAKNQTIPNTQYYGKAAGKNVVYIHLESFQGFLIDYQLHSGGKDYEVTPFLNSIAHSSDTLYFDNFYNQVGPGRTADAELMADNSLFGVREGAALVKYGTSNTFYAAPAILGQQRDYNSVVFHGNVGSFWNRDNAYKSFGYENFYSLSSYPHQESDVLGYGILDTLFLNDTYDMYAKMQAADPARPIYAKLLTVTNHFPYDTDKDVTKADFPKANTGDSTIDNYPVTANYLDQSLQAFFAKLKQLPSYNNTLFVFYGDHYGISNARLPKAASLFGKTEDSWTDYDNIQQQKVPLFYYMPGSNQNPTKQVNHTYGGEIDLLPTLMHLLGMPTNDYLMFGQDLLSVQHEQAVALRNGTIITPKYIVDGSTIYQTATGIKIEQASLPLADSAELDVIKANQRAKLKYSDQVLTHDLMRFYIPKGMRKTTPGLFKYRAFDVANPNLNQDANKPNDATVSTNTLLTTAESKK